MAATKRNAMLIAEAREKIRTTQLINRLQNHALGDLEMTDSQIKATNILLRKTMPDLQSLQHSGDPDAPVAVTIEDKRAAAKALLAETFGEKRE